MPRPMGGGAKTAAAALTLLLVATTTTTTTTVQASGTYGMTAKAMRNSSMEGSHNADRSFYDYIVVGSGPGGATVARLLSDDPKNTVLLLEAGENRDNDEAITDSADAWVVPVDYVPEYFWQIAMMHNNFRWSSHEWPDYPTRRLELEEEYETEAYEGRRRLEVERVLESQRFGGGKGRPQRGRRKLVEQVHRQLHGYTGEMGMEQYMGGRLMGGSSSINGEQYVWPTKKLLESIQAYVGGDPDWSPDSVYDLLRELEDYTGNSTQPRGSRGPLNVKQAPADPNANVPGTLFVDAINQTYPDIPIVTDYNDPATPLSAFYQWQLTQNPDGSRASSSTAMLSEDVRQRKNLVIKTRATAMYIKFKKNVAQGVYYTHAGIGTSAYARKEVIIAAGHRSSLLLENSGVGDANIIGPLLERVGFDVVANVSGVGKHLGNDGVLMLTMSRPNNSVPIGVPDDLYAGGAFLPYPNATTANSKPQITDRFAQYIGVTDLYGKNTFSIGAILLNTSSRGYAHIQSADPLYAPLVTAATFNNKWDRGNWWYLLRNQIKPVIDILIDQEGYSMISPPYSIFNDTTKNDNKENLFEFLFSNYIPAHHWHGTCKMGTDPLAGAVTDSAGRVYGVKKLRVADASIYPLKLDGNTAVPAYIAGGIVAKKILRGK